MFSQVTGQFSAKNVLQAMVASDRTPHALLLLGPPGSGALALALAFAQFVLCENPSGEDACGVCSGCLKTGKFIHPDVHFSYPVVRLKDRPPVSTDFLKEWRLAVAENPYMDAQQWLERLGGENKQGNITAEECGQILQKLSLTIFEGKKKILLMWLPEYLGKEGNRLLKMIEEPPADTLFLLVAENQNAILNTILSRCQLIKTTPLSDGEIIERLTESGIERGEAVRVAHLANGNLNEAFKGTKQEENDAANLFLDWMRICYKGNGAEMVAWTDQFAPLGRERQKVFFKYGLHFLRELLCRKMAGTEALRLRNNELITALKMEKIISFDKIEPITKLFNDCWNAIERNAHPKILILDAAIQMNKVLKKL